jgi:glycerol-3-phosphate acyltransferase PlsY
MTIIWIAVAFLSGSCMFSYWLGQIARINLKSTGDGNPGAINLWKAAGFPLGLAGIALDFMKGYLPLAFLIESDYIHSYEMVPIAVAPILGHAFSPFLKGKGGKAIAVTFGVWSALTRFEISLIYAVILLILLAAARLINKGKPSTSETDGFHVVLGMLLISIYVYWRSYSSVIICFGFCNFLILLYTHKNEIITLFKRRFSFRSK